jgi:hypothetical protein
MVRAVRRGDSGTGNKSSLRNRGRRHMVGPFDSEALRWIVKKM